MEQTELHLSAPSVPQHRRFVYRCAAADFALPHPLRRASDAHEAIGASALPRPLFAGPTAGAVLLQFRIAVTPD